MQLAINTGSLSDNTLEALARAAALGFRQVEITLQSHEFGYGYRRKPDVRFYRQLREMLDKHQLTAWSATAPQLTQAQAFSARARKDVLMGGAAAAGLLGSRVYVVQPADLFQDETALLNHFEEKEAPPVIDGFDETWAQVVNRRMTMALLNIDYWIGTPLTNQAQRLGELAEGLAIGCALDVRRALHRGDIQTWLAALGERLAVAYFYDLKEDGQPLAPAGDDWPDILSAFEGTRLKCAVLQTHPNQRDEEIIHSREMIQEIVSGSAAIGAAEAE